MLGATPALMALSSEGMVRQPEARAAAGFPSPTLGQLRARCAGGRCSHLTLPVAGAGGHGGLQASGRWRWPCWLHASSCSAPPGLPACLCLCTQHLFQGLCVGGLTVRGQCAWTEGHTVCEPEQQSTGTRGLGRAGVCCQHWGGLGPLTAFMPACWSWFWVGGESRAGHLMGSLVATEPIVHRGWEGGRGPWAQDPGGKDETQACRRPTQSIPRLRQPFSSSLSSAAPCRGAVARACEAACGRARVCQLTG